MLHGTSHQHVDWNAFYTSRHRAWMAFSKLLLLVSGSLLAIEHILAFYFPLKSMRVKVISFFVLFLLISFYTAKW